MARKIEFLKGPDGKDWVGFEGFNILGEKEIFLWAMNTSDNIEECKRFCGFVLLDYQIESKIGPAINRKKSLANRSIHTVSGINGIYIELKHRHGFNFIMTLDAEEILKKWKYLKYY